MSLSIIEHEVSYQNTKENITLVGTLTMPHDGKKHSAVILIAGYGPHDRDVTTMGHKHFKVLAEYLTSRGIAVLRYDKRGVGKSTGDWLQANSKVLADDVIAGIEYLKTRTEIDHDRIGIAGLSEGGLIATLVASQVPEVAFVVLMAPYIALGVEHLVYQAALILRGDGASEDFIERDSKVRTQLYTIARDEENEQVAAQKIQDLITNYYDNLSEEQQKEASNFSWALTKDKAFNLAKIATSPSYRFVLKYDLKSDLAALKMPVLMIVGDKDVITPSAPIFEVLEKAFTQSKHADYTLLELPNLNHVFQSCVTGAFEEYETIKEPMAPIALQTIADWIVKQAK